MRLLYKIWSNNQVAGAYSQVITLPPGDNVVKCAVMYAQNGALFGLIGIENGNLENTIWCRNQAAPVYYAEPLDCTVLSRDLFIYIDQAADGAVFFGVHLENTQVRAGQSIEGIPTDFRLLK